MLARTILEQRKEVPLVDWHGKRWSTVWMKFTLQNSNWRIKRLYLSGGAFTEKKSGKRWARKKRDFCRRAFNTEKQSLIEELVEQSWVKIYIFVISRLQSFLLTTRPWCQMLWISPGKDNAFKSQSLTALSNAKPILGFTRGEVIIERTLSPLLDLKARFWKSQKRISIAASWTIIVFFCGAILGK